MQNIILLLNCFSVPALVPMIMDRNGKEIRAPIVGPLDEGSALYLICQSTGGEFALFSGYIHVITEV